MKNYIKSIFNELISKINTHKHVWTLKFEHHNRDYSYKQEHYSCSCGRAKHVLRRWNQKPEVKITKNEVK